MSQKFYVVATLYVRVSDISRFEGYERQALGVAARHGAKLERAVRSEPRDGVCTEVHVISFPSSEDFARFRADPDIAAMATLRDAVIARTELILGFEAPVYAN